MTIRRAAMPPATDNFLQTASVGIIVLPFL
jgi:hypothetical protein